MRINEEELEYDGDITLYQGQPFTGIGYELFPNGNLMFETEYKDGFADGLKKKWYPSGQIQLEYSCKRGLRNGEYKEWHPNGSVKVTARYKSGVEIQYSEWDQNSRLVVSRKSSYEDAKFKGLEFFKTLHEG